MLFYIMCKKTWKALTTLQELNSQLENPCDDLNNDVHYCEDNAPLLITRHLARLRHLVYNLNLTVFENAVVKTAVIKNSCFHFLHKFLLCRYINVVPTSRPV